MLLFFFLQEGHASKVRYFEKHEREFRKGFAPELELHGTKASLSVNRITSELWIANSPDPATRLETIADNSLGNRFADYVFPSIQRQIAGQESDHPDLEDGWQVQRWVEAAQRSAETGGWVELD